MGIDQVGIEKVGIDRVGIDQVGIDRVGIDRVGIDRVEIDRMGIVRGLELSVSLYDQGNLWRRSEYNNSFFSSRKAHIWEHSYVN